MRRRIALVTGMVAAAGVLVLGLPLAIVGIRVVHDEATRRVDREADGVALAVNELLEQEGDLPADRLARLADDGRLVVVAPNGTTYRAGRPVGPPAVTARMTTPEGARIRLTISAEDARERALAVVGLVTALGLAGLAVGTGLGVLVARRVAAPLQDLADTSARLGAGDLSARAGHHGIAETDAVADAINDSAARIETLVHAERQFSANASHQLRTPLTALRMHLEELAATASTDDERLEVHQALEQADRLDATITELLALARVGTPGPPTELDVAEHTRRRVAAWRPIVAAAGRRLVLTADDECRGRAPAGAIDVALDALLDNAVRHGAGTVTVEVQRTGAAVKAIVGDEGAGIPTGAERRIFERHVSLRGGTGVGLALARTVLEAGGCRLDLVRARPPRFAILVPTGWTGPAGTLEGQMPLAEQPAGR